MSDNSKIGIPRTHPDFVKVRRQRFAKLLRQAHNTLKKDLTGPERLAVKELYQMIEAKELPE